MDADFTIRSATGFDAEAVSKLCEELGYPVEVSTMAARLAPLLSSADHCVYVAEDKTSSVFGWIQASIVLNIESGRRVEIAGLIVAGKTRRTGVGRSLVNAVETWAKGISADTIVVRSNIQRTESHPFYVALGYISHKTQAVYRKSLR